MIRHAWSASPILASSERPVVDSSHSGRVRSMSPVSSTNRVNGLSSPRRSGMGWRRAARSMLVMSSMRNG